MQERSDQTNIEPPPSEAITADWPAVSADVFQIAPTVTRDIHSTSGPNNALRQTVADESRKDESQYPDLIGLRVDAYIDCGGMGRVYKAFQETLNRTVAVKIITATVKDGTVPRERFRREVEALAQITHPNIVPIYTAGEWRNFPYFTMKYISGGPLTKHLPRLATDRPALIRLMVKVARGLHALHGHGIIHRDLKPLNILLESDDEPVIADFGLAKWIDDLDSEVSLSFAAIGTKYYMSPEQTLGLKQLYGPGCDIWSFGITLYEVLVGVRPFREELAPDTFEQIRKAEPEYPVSLPLDLAAIIRRCLQKQPQDRYPSASELADDLDRHLAGLPVAAAIEVRKPPKRRPLWPIASGIAAAFFALAALTVALWPAGSKQVVKKGVVERLQAGESVAMIPEKGMPEHVGAPLFGTNTQLTLNADGYASMNSAGVAGVELFNGPLPLPVRLKVDYAIVTVQTINSSGGVFAGRNDVPLGAGTQHSMVTLGHRTTTETIKGVISLREIAGFERMKWSGKPPGESRKMKEFDRLIPAPEPNVVAPNWRTVEVILTENDLRGTYEANPVPPFLGAENPQFVLGPGFGIFSFNAEVIFRNFIIEPLKP